MTDHDTDPAASAGAAGSALRNARPPKLERDLFIGNQWRPGSTGQTIGLVNPATEQPFGRAAAASAEDVDAGVQAARAAFDAGPWHGIPRRVSSFAWTTPVQFSEYADSLRLTLGFTLSRVLSIDRLIV
jgi:Aldehyde dehydrogenase family